MITESQLVPLYGTWWDPRYEFWTWSNVVCFQRCSYEEKVISVFYNRKIVLPERTDC